MLGAFFIVTLIIMALALSIDAFAISVARAICVGEKKKYDWLITALFFGIAQGIMPIFGYFLVGGIAGDMIKSGGGFIASIILGTIGIKMIIDAGKVEDCVCDKKPARKGYYLPLLFQAIATSIDAFAVGIGMFAKSEPIISSSIVIAIVTFAVCAAGYHAGSAAFENLSGKKVQYVAGAILLAVAIKSMI